MQKSPTEAEPRLRKTKKEYKEEEEEKKPIETVRFQADCQYSF